MSTPAGANITERAVLDALRGIKDPDLGKDIVTLGMVQDLHIHESNVTFTLAFSGQPPASKVALHSDASKAVSQIPGVSRVQVKMGSANARPSAPHEPPPADFIPEVKHTVAVSSGKGGVGKSTVAVNLALALKQMGSEVGLVDVDVYGPDVPLMMGARGKPGMFDNKIIPVEAHGFKIMSIGLFVAEREALGMFKKLNVPILGLVENMSYFVAPDTGKRYAIFGEGGGTRVAEEFDVPLLGQIPLEMETRKGGDAGVPIVVGQKDSAQAKSFREIAAAVKARVDAVSGLKLPTIG